MRAPAGIFTSTSLAVLGSARRFTVEVATPGLAPAAAAVSRTMAPAHRSRETVMAVLMVRALGSVFPEGATAPQNHGGAMASARAVRSLSPPLRGEGWGEGHL